MPPSDAAAHAAPPLNALQQDLLRKAELEAALIAAPGDARLRASYFDELVRFATVRTGLSHALLPELGHPLILRCGTADVLALARVFRDLVFDVPMRANPQRILVLGAHVGYATVYLAHRFPTAQILCVEPGSAAFRILYMNTLPCRRIAALNIAAWHSTTRLGVQARYAGDWGMLLHDQMADVDRVIAASSVGEILRHAGWERVDCIVCDIRGAERAVFADPGQPWLRTLDTLAIVPGEANPGDGPDPVAACFDPEIYAHAVHGEVQLYERHAPFRTLLRALPREMPLINSEPGLFPIALQDITPTSWSFFVFDGESCQLHPNPPGGRPARVIFPRTLDGHTRFTGRLAHVGRPSSPIDFTLVITREDGSEAFRATRTVNAGGQADFSHDLPLLHGRHHVILQTEMAAGTTHNYNAWAQFLSPRIG